MTGLLYLIGAFGGRIHTLTRVKHKTVGGGGNVLGGGECLGGGGKCPGGNVLGGNDLGGNALGGKCPGGEYPGGGETWWEKTRGGKVLESASVSASV